MISIICHHPTPGTIRSLRSQIFPPNAEVILITRPGSEGEVAAAAIDLGVKVQMLTDSINHTCPPYDSFIEAIPFATNDLVWLLPPSFIPAPRALADITSALSPPEPGAKIHLFRAIGAMTFPVHWHSDDPSEIITPREIILPCAVIPKGLAQLASFTTGEFGDVAFLSEVARLHPAGKDAVIKHNRLIAMRDLDPSLREERIDATLDPRFGLSFPVPTEPGDHWLFYPDPAIFPLHPDPASPCASLSISLRSGIASKSISLRSGAASTSDFYAAILPTIFPGWEFHGIFRPLMTFALYAAGGRLVSLASPQLTDLSEGKRAALRDLGYRRGNLSYGYIHNGLCYGI
jgi:hypothetical protein